MKMEERDRLIREEGEEIGKKIGKKLGEQKKLISQVLKKVKKGKSAEDISEELEEERNVILPIYHKIKEIGIDCSIDEIYQTIFEKED